jgi:hypothetical protein
METGEATNGALQANSFCKNLPQRLIGGALT